MAAAPLGQQAQSKHRVPQAVNGASRPVEHGQESPRTAAAMHPSRRSAARVAHTRVTLALYHSSQTPLRRSPCAPDAVTRYESFRTYCAGLFWNLALSSSEQT